MSHSGLGPSDRTLCGSKLKFPVFTLYSPPHSQPHFPKYLLDNIAERCESCHMCCDCDDDDAEEDINADHARDNADRGSDPDGIPVPDVSTDSA